MLVDMILASWQRTVVVVTPVFGNLSGISFGGLLKEDALYAFNGSRAGPRSGMLPAKVILQRLEGPARNGAFVAAVISDVSATNVIFFQANGYNFSGQFEVQENIIVEAFLRGADYAS